MAKAKEVPCLDTDCPGKLQKDYNTLKCSHCRRIAGMSKPKQRSSWRSSPPLNVREFWMLKQFQNSDLKDKLYMHGLIYTPPPTRSTEQKAKETKLRWKLAGALLKACRDKYEENIVKALDGEKSIELWRVRIDDRELKSIFLEHMKRITTDEEYMQLFDFQRLFCDFLDESATSVAVPTPEKADTAPGG